MLKKEKYMLDIKKEFEEKKKFFFEKKKEFKKEFWKEFYYLFLISLVNICEVENFILLITITDIECYVYNNKMKCMYLYMWIGMFLLNLGKFITHRDLKNSLRMKKDEPYEHENSFLNFQFNYFTVRFFSSFPAPILNQAIFNIYTPILIYLTLSSRKIISNYIS